MHKKEALFDDSKGLYALRSIFAGAFLTMSTAAGAIAADKMNAIHPSLGAFTFAFIFAWGLIFILFLHSELATSNMMYLTAGAYLKKISWRKAITILLYCTLFNIVGAVILGLLFNQTHAFEGLTAESFMVNVVSTKLLLVLLVLMFEGLFANVFVNTAIIEYLLIKDNVTKTMVAVAAVFMFVYLGNDHVVANFASFSLIKFSHVAGAVENFTILNILRQWTVAFIGNWIGGGVLMGLSYALFNSKSDTYLD